jgi:hypothetical protein
MHWMQGMQVEINTWNLVPELYGGIVILLGHPDESRDDNV